VKPYDSIIHMRSTAKNYAGFTLIELLLVVLVIGVLTGVMLTVINSGGIRSKARDAQRISDLKKIQTALELYFADNRAYPASSSWILVNGSSDILSSALKPNYINAFSVDPVSTPGAPSDACSNPTSYRYNYHTNGLGSNYVLTAMMEIATSNDGFECSALNNIVSGTVGGCSSWSLTSDVCYGTENP